MAKFSVQFVDDHDDEEVTASFFQDNSQPQPQFVDFYEDKAGSRNLVVRYRADDIRRIIREG